PKNKELNMVFHFGLQADLDTHTGQRSPVSHFSTNSKRLFVTRWQRSKRDEGFWNALKIARRLRPIRSMYLFIEKHDEARSGFGNDAEEWRGMHFSAKLPAILEVTTLSGTPYVLFQGQELGLKNFPRSWGIEEYKDVASQNRYHYFVPSSLLIIWWQNRQRESGKAVDMSDGLQKKARDHGRVPMQVKNCAISLKSNPQVGCDHAGFTTGTPWMRINNDDKEWNAAAQVGNEGSVRAFWKRAPRLRKDR
ncbi:hypothetical protein B0H11DRAFT_1722660, partial [Mycena galericulata]